MQVSYVNVFVSDLARATVFFRDKLGLPLQFSSAEHGYASFSAGGVRFTMPPARQPWGGFMAMISGDDGNISYLDQVSAAHG